MTVHDLNRLLVVLVVTLGLALTVHSGDSINNATNTGGNSSLLVASNASSTLNTSLLAASNESAAGKASLLAANIASTAANNSLLVVKSDSPAGKASLVAYDDLSSVASSSLLAANYESPAYKASLLAANRTASEVKASQLAAKYESPAGTASIVASDSRSSSSSGSLLLFNTTSLYPSNTPSQAPSGLNSWVNTISPSTSNNTSSAAPTVSVSIPTASLNNMDDEFEVNLAFKSLRELVDTSSRNSTISITVGTGGNAITTGSSASTAHSSHTVGGVWFDITGAQLVNASGAPENAVSHNASRGSPSGLWDQALHRISSRVQSSAISLINALFRVLSEDVYIKMLTSVKSTTDGLMNIITELSGQMAISDKAVAEHMAAHGPVEAYIAYQHKVNHEIRHRLFDALSIAGVSPGSPDNSFTSIATPSPNTPSPLVPSRGDSIPTAKQSNIDDKFDVTVNFKSLRELVRSSKSSATFSITVGASNTSASSTAHSTHSSVWFNVKGVEDVNASGAIGSSVNTSRGTTSPGDHSSFDITPQLVGNRTTRADAERTAVSSVDTLHRGLSDEDPPAVRTAIKTCTDGLLKIITELNHQMDINDNIIAEHMANNPVEAFIAYQHKVNREIIHKLDVLSSITTTPSTHCTKDNSRTTTHSPASTIPSVPIWKPLIKNNTTVPNITITTPGNSPNATHSPTSTTPPGPNPSSNTPSGPNPSSNTPSSPNPSSTTPSAPIWKPLIQYNTTVPNIPITVPTTPDNFQTTTHSPANSSPSVSTSKPCYPKNKTVTNITPGDSSNATHSPASTTPSTPIWKPIIQNNTTVPNTTTPGDSPNATHSPASTTPSGPNPSNNTPSGPNPSSNNPSVSTSKPCYPKNKTVTNITPGDTTPSAPIWNPIIQNNITVPNTTITVLPTPGPNATHIRASTTPSSPNPSNTTPLGPNPSSTTPSGANPSSNTQSVPIWKPLIQYNTTVPNITIIPLTTPGNSQTTTHSPANSSPSVSTSKPCYPKNKTVTNITPGDSSNSTHNPASTTPSTPIWNPIIQSNTTVPNTMITVQTTPGPNATHSPTSTTPSGPNPSTTTPWGPNPSSTTSSGPNPSTTTPSGPNLSSTTQSGTNSKPLGPNSTSETQTTFPILNKPGDATHLIHSPSNIPPWTGDLNRPHGNLEHPPWAGDMNRPHGNLKHQLPSIGRHLNPFQLNFGDLNAAQHQARQRLNLPSMRWPILAGLRSKSKDHLAQSEIQPVELELPSPPSPSPALPVLSESVHFGESPVQQHTPTHWSRNSFSTYNANSDSTASKSSQVNIYSESPAGRLSLYNASSDSSAAKTNQLNINSESPAGKASQSTTNTTSPTGATTHFYHGSNSTLNDTNSSQLSIKSYQSAPGAITHSTQGKHDRHVHIKHAG